MEGPPVAHVAASCQPDPCGVSVRRSNEGTRAPERRWRRAAAGVSGLALAAAVCLLASRGGGGTGRPGELLTWFASGGSLSPLGAGVVGGPPGLVAQMQAQAAARRQAALSSLGLQGGFVTGAPGMAGGLPASGGVMVESSLAGAAAPPLSLPGGGFLGGGMVAPQPPLAVAGMGGVAAPQPQLVLPQLGQAVVQQGVMAQPAARLVPLAQGAPLAAAGGGLFQAAPPGSFMLPPAAVGAAPRAVVRAAPAGAALGTVMQAPVAYGPPQPQPFYVAGYTALGAPILARAQPAMVSVTYRRQEPAPAPPPEKKKEERHETREERKMEGELQRDKEEQEEEYKHMFDKIRDVEKNVKHEVRHEAFSSTESYREPLERAKKALEDESTISTQPMPDAPPQEAPPAMEYTPPPAQYKAPSARPKLHETDFTRRFPDPVPGKKLMGTWRTSYNGQDLPADPNYLLSAKAY